MGLPLLSTGCSTLLPKSLGEAESGFTYVPLDPLAINVDTNFEGQITRITSTNNQQLLAYLPDNAVRTAYQQVTSSNDVRYGSGNIVSAGEHYKVIVDYINADTAPIRMRILKVAQRRGDNEWISVPLNGLQTTNTLPNTERYVVSRWKENNWTLQDELNYAQRRYPGIDTTSLLSGNVSQDIYTIPVYVGIGLRVTADVTSLRANVNISGLGPLSAAADARFLNGSLVIQTLGINGKAVSAALPINSELNQTTAQNALVSVASIKTMLYQDETAITPRVVGMYLPFRSDKRLINAIVSELATSPIPWHPRTGLCGTRVDPVSGDN